MSTRAVPHDIIPEILSGLPVKSLLRFKCVSKPWQSLIEDPKFISLHKKIAASKPTNHSLVISRYHSIYVYSLNTMENPIIVLPHDLSKHWNLVGVCNGIVCLTYHVIGKSFCLWNPATNQHKRISFPKGEGPKIGFQENIFGEQVSVGFGLRSSMDDDFVILCIRRSKSEYPPQIPEVQMFSTRSDSWKKIQVGFQFFAIGLVNRTIVKGMPFWVAIVDESREILLGFDAQNEIFKQIELPRISHDESIRTCFGEFKDRLALVVYTPSRESNNFVDVWILDDNEVFTKKISISPISLGIKRMLGFSLRGEILATTGRYELYTIHPQRNEERMIYSNYKDANPFCEIIMLEVSNYTESLISINGMKPLADLR